VSDTDQDVRAHRYTVSQGQVTDAGDFAVAASGTVEDSSSVAMAPNGSFSIAYQFLSPVTSNDIRLNRYSSSGAMIASGVIVANGPEAEQHPDIAIDNAGNAVVAYQKFIGGDFDIKARRVSSHGVVGAEINIRNTSRDEEGPSVALAPKGGQFVVAYFVNGQT